MSRLFTEREFLHEVARVRDIVGGWLGRLPKGISKNEIVLIHVGLSKVVTGVQAGELDLERQMVANPPKKDPNDIYKARYGKKKQMLMYHNDLERAKIMRRCADGTEAL